MARAGDACRPSLRDNSTRSIQGRLDNSRELARDASSKDMAFPPPPHFPAALPEVFPQGTPDGHTLSQPGPPVQPQQQSRGAASAVGTAWPLAGGADAMLTASMINYQWPSDWSLGQESRHGGETAGRKQRWSAYHCPQDGAVTRDLFMV